MHSYLKQKSFRLDLSSLRKKIFNPNDKILFDEAVKCFSSGAYRAAFVMIWISAAESLRNKISELALRDVEAGRVLGEIQKYEQQNISPDKIILDKSESLGLLSKDEHRKLEHIRNMRNSYAHPTGVAPSLEELTVAFQQVCSYILNRSAQLKYGYVSNLISSMFQNRHFLDDDDVKINEYAVGIAHRLHPEVLPYLVKKTCESYDVCSEDLIKRRAVHLISSLLKELNPNLSEDSWGIVSVIDQHPRAASLFLSIPEVWGSLPTQAKDMCFGHLVEPTRKDGTIVNPSPLRIKRLKVLESSNCLTDKQKEKFEEVLNKIPYESLISAKMSLADVASRIIKDLKSHNWYVQNPAIDAITNFGLNSIENLSESIQEELGRNILQSAEGNSGSAKSFVMEALKNQRLPKPFVKGLLKECFTNERCEFRVKAKVLECLLGIVIFQTNLGEIIKSPIEDINKSTPGSAFERKGIDTTVGIIERVITSASSADQIHLSKLRDALVGVKQRLSALLTEKFEN